MRVRRRALLIVVLASALAASGTATAPGSSGATADQIVFASTRLTANPGNIYALARGIAPRAVSPSPYADVGLATSPKGRAFAFWSNRTGRFRLMVSPGGGSAVRTVVVAAPGGTDPQYPEVPPVFSPDGTRLLVPYTPGGPAGRMRFALAAVRSGPARRISLPCEEAPAWSPDGQLLACTVFSAKRVYVTDLQGRVRFRAPGTIGLWSSGGRLAVAGTARTAVMDARGRVLERLSGVAQAWSPDGRLLALARPGSLVLAQPGHGGVPRVVAHGAGDAYYGVSFTPDGRDIAYSGSHVDEMIAPVAGGAPRRLGAGYGPVWSARGQMAFVVPRMPIATVEIADRLGGHARVVGHLGYDDHGLFTLAWLGDGSRLLVNDSVRDHADLWTMRADGSGQRRLTNTGHRIGEPAWNAGGTRLAYDDAPPGGGLCGYCGGSVALADADGRESSLVPGETPGQESSEGAPSWSPSGTQLAVTDDFNAGVYVTGLDGSGRAQIAEAPAASPAWSPDGTTIAYVSSFDGGAVWGVDPAGANPRRLLPQSKLKALSVAWSPQGALLAFDTQTGVYVAAPDGSGTPRLIARASITAEHARLSFSPDGSQVAYSALAGTTHPFWAIHVVGIDGKGLRQLTKGPFDSFDPAWRP